MNSYKPGQSVYYTLTCLELGVLVDPTAVALVLHSPDGTTINVPFVRDSTGTYHATNTIPINGKPGIWVERFQATLPDALEEREFAVEALEF